MSLKIIHSNIKANQTQYDLDGLAAKVSAYSFDDLKKYEYLTGEDLGYKPSVFEQAKFDYSQLGNIFSNELDKDDQKEGLFKKILRIETRALENIKYKNEELLNAFSAANTVSKAVKNQSSYNYDTFAFYYDFYRGFKKFKGMSLGFKYDAVNDFHTFLTAFINTHKASYTATKKT